MNELIQQILDWSKESPVLASLFGMYGLGVLTFLLRRVPMTIGTFIKRQATTTMTVTSQHQSYHRALSWFEQKAKNKKYRTIKLTNGRWGTSDTTKSLGYGHHWFWVNGQPLMARLIKEEANQTNMDKETLSFTKFGRNHNLFDNLTTQFNEKIKDDRSIEIYKATETGWWDFARKQRHRPLHSVFIPKKVQSMMTRRIDRFLDNEEWYINKGIPYQLGILLYGPPGTGKTSMIRAIATYLKYNIYYMPSSDSREIQTMVSQLPEKSLLVIEDIDTNYLTHGRMKEIEDDDAEKKAAEEKLLGSSKSDMTTSKKTKQSWASIGLSELLNALDGLFSAHGRILVATTNHIEKLDSALVRPGRIDMKIEIGYVNEEILKDFLESFFPEYVLDLTGLKIQEKITCAMLQEMVLSGMNPDNMVSEITNMSI